MLAIGTEFSTEFRTQQWGALEPMENLMKEFNRMEQKFEAGLDLCQQCKEMKKEAMAASFKRQQALPPAAFPQHQKLRDPVKDHCWEKEWDRKSKSRRQSARTCSERQGATSFCRNFSQESAETKSGPVPPAGPPPWAQQAGLVQPAGPPPGHRQQTANFGPMETEKPLPQDRIWTPTGQSARAGTPTGQSARACRTATWVPRRQSAKADESKKKLFVGKCSCSPSAAGMMEAQVRDRDLKQFGKTLAEFAE